MTGGGAAARLGQEGVLGASHEAHHLVLVLGVEGQHRREHHVEQHTEAPQVAGRAVRHAARAAVPREHLGRRVLQRAAEADERRGGAPRRGVAQVDEHQVVRRALAVP